MSLTEEQLAERHTGLGGSDAAPALGLSPWKSPLELFLDKRERRAIKPTPSMYWGTLLEPVIRQEYAQRTGRVVRMPPSTLRHAKHEWMLAHVDGFTDDKRIFEAKTARTSEGWGSDSDAVPHDYLLQVQHYLAVSQFKVADIAVLIGGSDFRIYEIEADTELQSMIIEGEREFWELVQSGNPPPPSFDTGDPKELLRKLYPGTNGETVTAGEREAEFRRVNEFAVNAVKSYERLAESSKAHLLYTMGEAARMVFPDGMQLTRKVVNRKGYSVEPTTYIDARFSRVKENAE